MLLTDSNRLSIGGSVEVYKVCFQNRMSKSHYGFPVLNSTVLPSEKQSIMLSCKITELPNGHLSALDCSGCASLPS